MRPYLALFKNNMLLTLRDRSVLFFNYLFPLIFFFGFAELFHAGVGAGIAYFVSTALADFPLASIILSGLITSGLVAAVYWTDRHRRASSEQLPQAAQTGAEHA